jgi:hypothetical protein
VIVKTALDAWRSATGSAGEQLARNIESETGLTVGEFEELLKQFADELGKPGSPDDAWKAACANRSLLGKRVPDNVRPQVLGRAEKLPSYVRRLAVTGDLSALRHGLVKHAGNAKPPAALRRKMAEAPLASANPVWATFQRTVGDEPFAGIPADTESVRTVLGLGFAQDNAEPFVLLRWEAGPPGGLSLHRPTIADAGTYHYFRPNPDTASPYGKTRPLSPNPGGLGGLPEVVHRNTAGKSLVFPYHLTST